MTLSSRTSQRSSPGTPGWNSRGVRLVELAKICCRGRRVRLPRRSLLAGIFEVAQDVEAVAIDDDGPRAAR